MFGGGVTLELQVEAWKSQQLSKKTLNVHQGPPYSNADGILSLELPPINHLCNLGSLCKGARELAGAKSMHSKYKQLKEFDPLCKGAREIASAEYMNSKLQAYTAPTYTPWRENRYTPHCGTGQAPQGKPSSAAEERKERHRVESRLCQATQQAQSDN